MIQERIEKQTRFAILQAYGRLVYRFRWLILSTWCVVFCAGLPLAAVVSTALTNSGYTIMGSASSKVTDLLVSTFHHPKTQILAVFQSSTTSVTDPAYQEELTAFIARMQVFPHVVSVTSGGPGRDGRSAFVSLGFDQDANTVASYLADLRTLAPHTGPAQVVLTGEAAVNDEVQRDTQQGLEMAELIALPLTLLVLVFVFGSLMASLLPLLLAAVVVVISLATIDIVTWYTSVNIFAQSLITVLGLGLAIDYSLLLLRRFREELARGETVREAVSVALATAGEAIFMSGIIVVIGFAGLLLVGIGVMTSFSLAGMTVASTAVLAALTLLPALVSILGSRVDALRVPQIERLFRLPGMNRQRREKKAPGILAAVGVSGDGPSVGGNHRRFLASGSSGLANPDAQSGIARC